MEKKQRFITIIVLLFCTLLSITKVAYGQLFSYSIARYVEVKDSVVPDGSVVSQDADGTYALTRKAYDAQVRGIVVNDPAIYVKSDNPRKRYSIIGSGEALVRVSTAEGPIKKGDLLRSSTMPGVLVRAAKSGFVVGIAMEGFSEVNTKSVGTIRATLDIHFAPSVSSIGSALTDIFSLSALATYEQPLIVFKYVIAAIITLSSFIFGFLYFGRIASRGVEALGRNPLASRSIQFGIAMNVLMTFAIIGVGIIVSLFIIQS